MHEHSNSRQTVKWVVYALLLANFLFYFGEEIYFVSYTLSDDANFLDWTGAFATTLDEIGWLGLIFLFELETYQLSDEAFERRPVRWTIHGVRFALYILLAHTVVERLDAVLDYKQVSPSREIASLCDLTDKDVSFGSNYRYSHIDTSNCDELAGEGPLYFLEPGVVTDQDGYVLEEKHVWVDLLDACIWLVVVLLVELAVRFQGRGVAGSTVTWIERTCRLLYGILLANAAFWAWTGHWVYTWDQVVWIAGFWMIGNNLAEWRDEMGVDGRFGQSRRDCFPRKS